MEEKRASGTDRQTNSQDRDNREQRKKSSKLQAPSIKRRESNETTNRTRREDCPPGQIMASSEIDAPNFRPDCLATLVGYIGWRYSLVPPSVLSFLPLLIILTILPLPTRVLATGTTMAIAALQQYNPK